MIMNAGAGREEGRGGGGNPRRKGAQTRGFSAMGPDWDRGH